MKEEEEIDDGRAERNDGRQNMARFEKEVCINHAWEVR